MTDNVHPLFLFASNQVKLKIISSPKSWRNQKHFVPMFSEVGGDASGGFYIMVALMGSGADVRGRNERRRFGEAAAATAAVVDR